MALCWMFASVGSQDPGLRSVLLSSELDLSFPIFKVRSSLGF